MSLVQDLFGGSIMSDEDTSLKGSSGNYGKFGLNKAKLVKVEFNPNAGKDGAPTNALDIEVNIGEEKIPYKDSLKYLKSLVKMVQRLLIKILKSISKALLLL